MIRVIRAETAAAAVMVTIAILRPACANAEDIAMSLVHPKGRIDVPVSDIRGVETWATTKFRTQGTQEVHEYPNPHVIVCFAHDVPQRICQLTRRIVGEPLSIVIDCEIVSEPVVNEPLCANSCFEISASDVAEANALAQRIRKGTNRACAPSS
jgi:preprotein translocase subunit SecD